MQKLHTALLVGLLAATTHAQTGNDTSKIRKAANAAVAKADWKAAIDGFQQLVDTDPMDGSAWHMLGYSLHTSGNLDAALKAHLKATEFPDVAPIACYNAACVFALRKNKDEALSWLGKAAKAGFARAEHMEEDSDMDILRDEPRYAEIVAQIEKNATSAREPSVQVFAGTSERKLTRMVMFAGKGSIGGVSISYGQPKWLDKYDQAIASPKYENYRWRFGKDEWTTLDTSVALKLGDQQLAPGIYYLTIARRDTDFVLAAIDPAEVHAQMIDPYMANRTTGGTEVILKHEKTDEVSSALEIELAQTVGAQASGNLVISFGPHKLSTTFALLPKK